MATRAHDRQRFMLTKTAAQLMRRATVACKVTDKLMAELERKGRNAHRSLGYACGKRIERRQADCHRPGLGYAGVHIGGVGLTRTPSPRYWNARRIRMIGALRPGALPW